VQPVRYLDFFADPDAELRRIYAGLRIPLRPEAASAMKAYIAAKPKDKFGEHDYETGSDDMLAAERRKFRRFQEYFAIADEV
jgi:hypothetical protein